jgi:hypothetical protein
MHFVAAMILAMTAVAAPAEPPKTDYMAVFLLGQKIGFVQKTRTVSTGRVHSTTANMSNTGDIVEAWSVETEETADGQPIGFKYHKQIPAGRMLEGSIRKGALTLVKIEKESATTEQKPWPAGALLSEGMNLLMKKKGLQSGTSYSFVAFDASAGTANTVHVQVKPSRQVQILDHTETLHEVQELIEDGPELREYLNDDFDLRKMVLKAKGMEIEWVACTQQYASSPNGRFGDAFALEVPGSMWDYRNAESICYEIVPDGKASFQLPVTDSQQVEELADGAIRVTVAPVTAPTGATFPYTGNDPQVLAALKATATLQCEDPKVIALAKSAIAGSTDAAEAAQRIEGFVRLSICPHLNPLEAEPATATEIIAKHAGRCRHHACLVATMLRAVGIPAKLISGVMYSQSGKMMWHAWVSALIGGKWVDYDSAQEGFDAGHLAIVVEDGDADNAKLAQAMGHFSIRAVLVNRAWYKRPTVIGPIVVLLVIWAIYRRRRRRANRSAAQWPDGTTPSPADVPIVDRSRTDE